MRRHCLSGALIPGLLVLLLSGCAALGPASLKTRHVAPAREASDGYLGLPLSSGQVFVSETGDPYSLLFTLAPARFSPYVHIGIISVEDGVAYVYEAHGLLSLVFSGPPTDAIQGRIKRRPLSMLIKNNTFVSIYEPPEEIHRDQMLAFARRHYEQRTPFDAYMNTQDPGAMYCAEFVARAYEAGGVGVDTVPFRNNPSMAVLLRWLKVRSQRLYHAVSLVDPEHHVATLSTRKTLRELRLYNAAKEEIYARFGRDQKLGNVFRWTGTGLVLRKDVKDFLDRAQELLPGRTPTPSQAGVEVRRFAAAVFDRPGREPPRRIARDAP